MKKLHGKVAVVTGASRGVGRGIACVLGEAGATVYVTGRSTRGVPTTDSMPGTIEDTAEEVSQRGGHGIPAPCDHTVDEQVRALFERVEREQGRLDLLVNNAWGGYEGPGLRPAPFWKAPLRLWDAMFTAGLKAHLVASYFAVPLMLPRRRGLIVSTVAWDHDKYLGSFYDIAKHAIVRMIYGLAIELRPHKIAAVAVAPGFMRTERVLRAFKADEQNWKKFPGMKRTETPEYVGRAVAALAADPRVLRKSGRAFHAGELAREYGFTDVDGRRVPPFRVPPFLEVLRKYYKE
jgi:NAD(P)-dependent dehydrogenase (short-subunit alcohol dehydrogenase family)